MTKEEFKVEIHTIASCFPKFRPLSTDIYKAYYDHLYLFPAAALKWAGQTIVQSPDHGRSGTEENRAYKAGDFPTTAELFDLCRVWMREREVKKIDQEKLVYNPMPHECLYVEGKADTKCLASLILRGLEPYEAAHVACQGQPELVCPHCEKVMPPQKSDFLAKMMEIWPNETKGWNPWWKGPKLCRNCKQYGSGYF